MQNIFDLLLHLDKYLPQLINQYGTMIYVILFVIIFIETGVVVFPFLPGDSLLFLAGSIAAMGKGLNVWILLGTLMVAAIAGDSLNYEIGKKFGHHIENSERWSRFIKPENLQESRAFFKKHGPIAIFLGRFMPLIRTFIPFTAGGSDMPYHKFIMYNVLGGISWVLATVLSGFFFGNIPFVKDHFELIMVLIILISLLPAAIVGLRKRVVSKKELK